MSIVLCLQTLSVSYVAELWILTSRFKDLSLSHVQKICLAAAAEGSTSSTTAAIAGLGSSGKHSQNIQRDFHRMMARDLSCYIEPTYISVPLGPATV